MPMSGAAGGSADGCKGLDVCRAATGDASEGIVGVEGVVDCVAYTEAAGV